MTATTMPPSATHNYYESREFYNDLDAAEQDIANGKGICVSCKQELDALFA